MINFLIKCKNVLISIGRCLSNSSYIVCRNFNFRKRHVSDNDKSAV